MKRLNVKLLLYVVPSILILLVGVHFLHAVQVKRNAGSVLSQAETAREKGDLEQARKLYKQYLTLSPDDDPTFSKLAVVSASVADDLETFNRRDFLIAKDDLNRAVVKDPDNLEIRRKLAEYCLRPFGKFAPPGFGAAYSDAITHLTHILKTKPDDPELLVMLADCKAGLDRRDEAITILQAIVGFDATKKTFDEKKAKAPKYVDAYRALADVLMKKPEDPEAANAVLNRLIEVNPDSKEAFYWRAMFASRHQLPKATSNRTLIYDSIRGDVNRALELDPDYAEALLLSSQLALRSATADDFQRAIADARKTLQHGIEKYPKNDLFHQNLVATYLSEAALYAADMTKTKDPSGGLRKAKLAEALARVNDGLASSPRSFGLLRLKVTVQLERGDLKDVRNVLSQMQEVAQPAVTNYYEALVLAREEKWAEAAKILERVRSQLPPTDSNGDATQQQADFYLGQCYERLKQPDRQLEAYKRVLQTDPTNMRARLGKALALSATGQPDESLVDLQYIKNHMTADQFYALPMVWQLYLKLQIADQMRKPENQRDWTEVNAVQAETTKRQIMEGFQQAILNAESLQLKGDFDQARKLLMEARGQNPKEPSVWFALAALEQRSKGPTAALAVMDEAQQTLGDSVSMRLLRSELLARLGGANLKKSLAAMEQNVDQFSNDERTRLWQGLGEIYYSLRESAEAQRLWRRVAQARPDDSTILLGLFQLARETDDPTSMQAALDDIKEKFGKDSAEWKFTEAMRLVNDAARQPKPENISKARALLQDASDKRPGWHEVARLQAQIQIMEGNTEGAIANLERALDLGPPNINVVRQLAGLLGNKNDFKEAKRVLGLLPVGQRNSDIKKLDAQVELGLNNPETALRLAADAVASAANSWEMQWWYGQFLNRANKANEAETAFRRAVELGGDKPEAWRALVAHLAVQRKPDAAREALRAAEAKLPPDQLTMLMAQSQEALGDTSQAEHYYEIALKERPNELDLAQTVAKFYLRASKPEKVKSVLNQILAKPASKDDKANWEIQAWGRRELARMLATTSIYSEQQKAIELINANMQDARFSDEDMVFKANILAARSDPASRRQAIDIYEDLLARGKLREGESLMLARLYDSAGDWAKARTQLSTVIAKVPDNIPLMTTYVQILLQRDEVNEAANWINRLESMPTAKLTPDTLALKARLLVKQNKPKEAIAVLNSLLPQPLPPDQVDRVAAVANQFDQLKLYPEAEKLYRRFVELKPSGKLALAQYLGQHGRLDEALNLCDEARKDNRIIAVISVAVATLRDRQAEAKTEHYQRVEQWLNKAMLEEPGFHPLELRYAEFKEMQGQYDEVERTYRKIIDAPDTDPMLRGVALNNLGYILAMQEPAKQGGLPLIEQSIQILGPVRDVLDTRAMVYLAVGDVKNAQADMASVFSDFNLTDLTDKSFGLKYFHLALVKQKAGDTTGAREAMQRAQKFGLKASDVTVIERKRFEDLERELGLKQSQL